MILPLLLVASLVASAHGCADHTHRQRGRLSNRHLSHKREEVSSTNPSYITADWAYDASYNWGAIQPDYANCQTGTQQSPIALSLTGGLSSYHHPTFENYDRNVSGNWTNWGYGPAFTLDHRADDYTGLPSVKWDNETAYLKGWHIHAPADHSVGGDRSKAEMHLVHVNTEGHEVAVLAIRLDPGTSSAPFFAQLPEMVPFVTGLGRSPDSQPSSGNPKSSSRRRKSRRSELGDMLTGLISSKPSSALSRQNEKPQVVEDVQMDMALVLEGVYRFNEFWTYKGSLTSPPCMEGIRWFVARTIAFTSIDQMRAILGACTYSARAEQEVWLHEINSA
ncbi:MAG: hypothetical protein L6R40_001531 [Gallowayella cf. fulva]|nr:MAG: hypothetical protein L6R40_001531 [Xanthomendoza cf. fulva]